MTTRVILVRHGQSTYNLKKLIQGQIDISTLTDLGLSQARQVGETLKAIAVDALYASPLKRAFQTAETLREVMAAHRSVPPVTPNDNLKEINLPLWEGFSFEQAEREYPQEFRQWFDDPANFAMALPDGSRFFPVRSLYDRAATFWRETLPQHPDQTLLIVAHSAINRALIATALGLGPERHENLHQANCALSVINFTGKLGDAVQLESMNLTGHMGETLPPMRGRYRGPRLLLVRHGETEWNRQKRFQGQIDIPLNDNGKHQGEQAATFLKDVPIDAAATSPLSRPKETAQIILQHHPGIPLDDVEDLKEIGHGAWEGLYDHEIESGYPGLLAQWQAQPETVQMPGEGGENLEQVWARSIAAWKSVVAKHSGPSDRPVTVLVTAHDAVNKAILCHVVGLGPDSFWKFKQGNGAVSVIDYPDGVDSAPVLTAANLTLHLSGSIFDQTAAGAL